MAVRKLGVVGVARGFGCPVQQRHVQQTINNVAVVVLGAQRAPGLKEPTFFLKPRAELVGCQKRGAASFFAAGQLVGRHAGRAVQKTHVVVVHLDLVFNAVQKAVHQCQGGIFERFVAGALIAQPDLTRPEPAGPLVVFARRVDIVNTGMILAVVGKQRQVPAHQPHGGIQRRRSLVLGQNGGFELF